MCIVADVHLQRRGGGGGDHLDAEIREGSVKKKGRLGFSLIENLGEHILQARSLDPSLVYVLQFGLKIL